MNIMVNGLPGNMAANVAESIIKSEDLELTPEALTGEEIEQEEWRYGLPGANISITLHKPSVRESKIQKFKSIDDNFISVDFTQPSAIEENIDFYCKNGLPFVCGTTGGKRDSSEPGANNSDTIQQKVRDSNIVAVIAPNMGKQIVALQQLMEDYAKNHPNTLQGYDLEITDSHQKGKKDTSGTAKAMVSYFNALGIPFEKGQIDMIRDPHKQENGLFVPSQYLGGHGWHTYTLSPGSEANIESAENLADKLFEFLSDSPVFGDYEKKESETKYVRVLDRRSKDGTVFFRTIWDHKGNMEIRHDVNGRDIYASGTLDAVRFLEKKIEAGEKGKVYSMIDVLEGN